MKKKKIIKSSGNVFADLGFKNPEEYLAKAELARQIYRVIKMKRLTQRQAAKLLGIDQAKISYLVNGRLSGFSTDRLIRYLNILGQDVELKVRPKPRHRKKAHLTVHSAAPRARMVAMGTNRLF